MDEPITTPTVTEPSPSITVMDNPAEEQIEVRTNSDSGGSLLDNTTSDNENPSDESLDNASGDSTSKSTADATLEEDIAKHDKLTASIEKDLKNRGYDIKRAMKEYEETGDISTRTLADLAAAGYPKELVESILSSQKALEERFVNAVYDRAGGKAEFERTVQWAAANLPQGTVDAFNEAIDSSNLEVISLMLEGIKSRMVSARGTANPTIIGGAGGSSGATKGFASKVDMIKAMSDPRYGRDSTYTRSVEQKMLYTNF